MLKASDLSHLFNKRTLLQVTFENKNEGISLFTEIEKMKLRRYISAALLAFLLLSVSSSCHTTRVHASSKKIHTNAKGEMPPGQKKKITGEKSAKKYAPGQKKK